MPDSALFRETKFSLRVGYAYTDHTDYYDQTTPTPLPYQSPSS